jgi:hypothetical protein
MGLVQVSGNSRTRSRTTDTVGGGAVSNAVFTGGTITINTPTLVEHRFTASGTLAFIAPGSIPVDYLAQAGGGGGGGSIGGGGGGGEAATGTTTITDNQAITIGGGGAGGTTTTNGAKGTDTVFGTVDTAAGGGAGGRKSASPFDWSGAGLGDGGNGGGGGVRVGGGGGLGGTGVQFNGGSAGPDGAASGGGGGGGAGQVGGNAPGGTEGGDGGNGLEWPASSGQFWGGGGGGGTRSDDIGPHIPGSGGSGGGGAGGVSTAGTAGTANTGGGGGGGSLSSSTGGGGGSGVVIVRYDPTDFSHAVATGGTIITDTASLVEHEFSAGGTFALNNKGLLPVAYTISGTGTFGGSGVSGSVDVIADVAVTVTSGTVVVAYNPADFERGHPLGYSTLEFFVDGGLSSITDAGGGAVSQWNDLSTNADHLLQATATNQPLTGTTSQNGINTIDYDGTDNYMEGGSFAIDVSGKAVTIFTVLKFDATGTGKAPLNMLNSGGSGLNCFLLEHNTNFQVVYGNGAAGFNNANFREIRFTGFPGTSAYFRCVITIETTNGPKLWLGGVAQTPSNGSGTMVPANFLSSSASAWKPVTGRRPDPFYFDGKIGTYGILSEVLSDVERTALDAWLADRWGV